MTDIDAFLNKTDWRGADRVPLAGDASKRRYERLVSKRLGSAILMIAPPALCGSSDPFVTIATHLTSRGYSAPEILASDLSRGLLLLEDLGDDLFAQFAEDSRETEQMLYEAAVDFLANLHEGPPPSGLEPFDSTTLAKAVDIASIWYAQCGTGGTHPALQKAFATCFQDMPDLTRVLILRDFHAENLIWLPDRMGHARVGLLDFQDALLGHRSYDLVSLLQDARRDVPEALASQMVARYVATSGVDGAAFDLAYAAFGAQRNLRILGIFARLSLADGKRRYLDFIPRVWNHVITSLSHPDLADLRSVVLECIPEPTSAHLARFRPA